MKERAMKRGDILRSKNSVDRRPYAGPTNKQLLLIIFRTADIWKNSLSNISLCVLET